MRRTAGRGSGNFEKALKIQEIVFEDRPEGIGTLIAMSHPCGVSSELVDQARGEGSCSSANRSWLQSL